VETKTACLNAPVRVDIVVNKNTKARAGSPVFFSKFIELKRCSCTDVEMSVLWRDGGVKGRGRKITSIKERQMEETNK